MNAVSLLMIIVGIFIIINAPNFVDVLKGNAKFGAAKPATTSKTSASGGAVGQNKVAS